MNMMKESYERSALLITVFDKEDVITTSSLIDLDGFDGDNNTTVIPNGSGGSKGGRGPVTPNR